MDHLSGNDSLAERAASLPMEEEEEDSGSVSSTSSVFFNFVVPGILLNGIGLLGLAGNAISALILSRPQMKSSINCILIGALNWFVAYLLLFQHFSGVSKIPIFFAYFMIVWLTVIFSSF